MKNILELAPINLTKRDTKVYEALLSLGPSSIRAVADATRINRGSVYESIKALEPAGLVSFSIKTKQKRYFAEEPEKILDLIEAKKSELDTLRKDSLAVMPRLKNKTSKIVASNVRFYEEAEGIAVILRDVLATGKNYQVISSKPLREFLYKKYPNYTKQRIEKGIHVDVIAIGSGGDKVLVANRKWLEAPNGTAPSSYTIIYGDKVALIGLTETRHIYGTVTEDRGVAEMQKLAFQKLWDTL